MAEEFFDLAQEGRETVDLLGFMGEVVPAAAQEGVSPTDYTRPPAGAAPARPGPTRPTSGRTATATTGR